MNDTEIAKPSPGSPPPDRPHFTAGAHFAAFMLLLATVAWGFGFTWSKTAQDAINATMGLPPEAALGPVWLLSVRFLLAGIILLVVVPAARSGWSRASLARATALGGLLGFGMTLQHLGLGRTTEAVSAFLTSLTVLFVPLLMTFVLRRPPRAVVWGAIAIATLGIWLMTGATPTGFGLGELLGLGCAIVFSVHLIAINHMVPRDNAWRMIAGQFIAAGLLTTAACLFVARGPESLLPEHVAKLLSHRDIGLNLALLLVLPGLFSYTVLNFYQPRMSPTRAVLIYLMEPIFAAAYAWMMRGRALGGMELLGAGLILAANGIVELLANRNRRGSNGVQSD